MRTAIKDISDNGRKGMTKRHYKKFRANDGTNSVQTKFTPSWVEYHPEILKTGVFPRGISVDGIPGKIHKSMR